jgi:hypothetical protein
MATTTATAAAAIAINYSKQFILHPTAIVIAILSSSKNTKRIGFTRIVKPAWRRSDNNSALF